MALTTIGTYLLIFWFIVTGLSLRLTRDIAAPQLLYCAAFGFFFFSIFIEKHSIYLYLVYVSSLLIVLASCFLYNTSSSSRNKIQLKNQANFKVPAAAIWFLSLPAILGMLYMIEMFGGLSSYIVAAQHGTKSFWGMGPLKTIIATYYPLSLYYFALMIAGKRTRTAYIIFSFHFVILVVLALLSLSRGTLLTHLVFMVLVWHFARKKLSSIFVAFGLLMLISFASVYGVVRETLTIDDGNFSVGLDNQEQVYKSEWMEFGTFPFERVVNANEVKKHFGSTYVTAITIFVPRNIWPEKPDPGGVVFTNEYAPEFYDEFSHFTTGLYPEAMMNFGIVFGIIFGHIQLTLMLILLSIYYKNVNNKLNFYPKTHKSILGLVIYIYVTWGMVMLMTGEFTTIVKGIIIKVIVLMLSFVFLRLSLKRKI